MKILIVASDSKSLIDFRGDLLKEIISKGHSIIAISPEMTNNSFFDDNKIKFVRISLKRAKITIFNDINYYFKLKSIIKKENPDLIFSYSLKPVIYTSLSSGNRFASRVYSMLPGLGSTFMKSKKITTRIISLITKKLLKKAMKYNVRLIVQNNDDLEELVVQKICQRSKIVRVNSSGINMEVFNKCPLPENIVFLMAARLLKSKGIYEYIEAAKIIKKTHPEVKFLLLGGIDSNSDSITQNELDEISTSDVVEYKGNVSSIYETLLETSVFVLPSYYREGVPRSIQEAMSMGRPIITTNWVGCKETVVDNFNGFLVNIRNHVDLAKSMETFITNPQLISLFGNNSHNLCKEKFDIKLVNKQMISFLNLD